MTKLLTLLALVLGVVVTPAPRADAADRPEPEAFTSIGLSDAEQAMAERSFAAFQAAGLQLPNVVVRRHHDLAACGGFDGLYRDSKSYKIVELCTDDAPEWVERTLLHELAHAWSFHHLSRERRQAFEELRGSRSWLDYDGVMWKDNGAEQAAEIIAWGLNEYSVPVLRIDHDTCAELLAGYVTLTGHQPLYLHTDHCQSITRSQRS